LNSVFLHTMKKLTLILFVILPFLGCKDKPTIILPAQNAFEVMPSKFIQNILVEAFGGEWCAPCVEGVQKIEFLKTKYPNRIKSVSIHNNDWLEIPYQTYLATWLGGLVSYPRASVNRTLGEQTLDGLDDTYTLLSLKNWDNTINNNINQEAPVSIALETVTTSTNIGKLNVYIARKYDISSDTRIGIYFVEDNIQSVFQQGANANYIHQNVLKNVFNYEGDTIKLYQGNDINTNESTEIIKKQFTDIDLTKYNVMNLKIIVFVFNYNNDFRKMRILNVQEVKWGGNKYWDVN
jgi:thiol-disulfide isomerase/thioredoxin